MLEHWTPPPLVMIAPRSATPKRTPKRTTGVAAVRINYCSAQRAPPPFAVFRSSNPGGESHEAETLLEESIHLMDEIAQLNSDVRPLREDLRHLMEDFNVTSPKLDGSSAPCILTRELESAREDFDRVCAEETELLNQFSIDATSTLKKTVKEQRQLFEALKLSVESVEQELVEAEAEIESRGLKVRKQKYENGNRTQHALRSELNHLREREREIRRMETEQNDSPKDSGLQAEDEIERLTRELLFLRRYKQRQLEQVQGGGAEELEMGGCEVPKNRERGGAYFYTGDVDQMEEDVDFADDERGNERTDSEETT
jgi:hypothetical protein